MFEGRKIISVSGPGQCGKDHVAKIIADLTGLRYVHSTSWAAADLILQHVQAGGWLKHGIGKFAYKNVTECYEDRRNHRDLWARFIGDINCQHKDNIGLYVKCLQYQDILTGVRWKNEFTACREHLIDIAIWVERPFVPEDKTMQYDATECHFIIRNPLVWAPPGEHTSVHTDICSQMLKSRIKELLTKLGGFEIKDYI